MEFPQALSHLSDGDRASAEDEAPTGGRGDTFALEPLVSVIMAVRDREYCVARAIASVLAQTYRNLELIVIDDGSSDGTRRVIEGFGDRVRLFAREHEGPYEARNFALGQARGDLIAFIDSDDRWHAGKLAAQVPLMRRAEVGLVFGDTVHLTEPRDGAARTGRTSFAISPPSRGRIAHHLVWSNFVPTCTVLVRRSCLDEIGGFRVSSRIAADYPAWFRIALRHEIDHVEGIVADYTVHSRGISFDLGLSLAARIGLFAAELERETETRAKELIRRLLFNLSLHLGLAIVRGRAGSVERPASLALRTAWRSAGSNALRWSGAFAWRQLMLRARRLTS